MPAVSAASSQVGQNEPSAVKVRATRIGGVELVGQPDHAEQHRGADDDDDDRVDPQQPSVPVDRDDGGATASSP